MVRGPLFHVVIFVYWEAGANRAHDYAHNSNKGTAHDTHATHNMCVLIIFLFGAARDGTSMTAVGASASDDGRREGRLRDGGCRGVRRDDDGRCEGQRCATTRSGRPPRRRRAPRGTAP